MEPSRCVCLRDGLRPEKFRLFFIPATSEGWMTTTLQQPLPSSDCDESIRASGGLFPPPIVPDPSPSGATGAVDPRRATHPDDKDPSGSDAAGWRHL